MSPDMIARSSRIRLIEMLGEPRFEMIPLSNAIEQARHLPTGATVTVTASPSKGMGATMTLVTELAAAGFEVIPHISARLIKDKAELATILTQAKELGLSRAFVVGGDATEPGEFFDGMAVLRAMEDLGHQFAEIGVPGYPEGHPFIPRDQLRTALAAKTEMASGVTTQMCFDDGAIRSWIRSERLAGMGRPLRIGIPGVAPLHRLVRVAARIGVGDSARFLTSHKSLVGRLVRPGGYAPDELLLALADLYTEPAAQIEGFHIYTFNQIETTEQWRREFMAELSEAA